MFRRLSTLQKNPYSNLIKHLGETSRFYSIEALNDSRILELPFSIRVFLESAIRNCDESSVTSSDIETILSWKASSQKIYEVPFTPSRVVLQDLTGVPALIDLASMRDILHKYKKSSSLISPPCPVDLIINQEHLSKDLLAQNFEMNKERYQFMKWGQKAIQNFNVIPPSQLAPSIKHEYLARIVFNKDGILYPDSVITTDNFSTMVNGLGVLGLGVGGIEAETIMLGQPILMAIPKVIGFKLVGKLNDYVTAKDVSSAIGRELKNKGLSGHFVEFFGDGCKQLRISHRVTIANLAKEYGAALGYFPTDEVTLTYLKQTGKSSSSLLEIESLLKSLHLYQTYNSKNPDYSDFLELDLSTVKSSISGPKRLNDKMSLSSLPSSFTSSLSNPIGFQGYGLSITNRKGEFNWKGQNHSLPNGSLVKASINPIDYNSSIDTLIAAGLIARKAAALGLKIKPYINATLDIDSESKAGLDDSLKIFDDLKKIGFDSNETEGDLQSVINDTVFDNDLIVCSVSCNEKKYDSIATPYIRANYLASPALIVAFALAGRIDVDFEKECVGVVGAREVYLKDLWPSRGEIHQLINASFKSELFRSIDAERKSENSSWGTLECQSGDNFVWDEKSTYIKPAPFFKDFSFSIPKIKPIKDAYCLLNLGHNVTRDVISPENQISRNSQASQYLQSQGVAPDSLNTFASRRGNWEVMVRGTYSSTQLRNNFCLKSGPSTIHFPSDREMSVYEASQQYKKFNHDLIILAGKNYGSGPSIGWATKGPYLLGVRAIIAESFNFMHSSNLLAMGILPLQYKPDQNSEILGLTGREKYSIDLSRLGSDLNDSLNQKNPNFNEKNLVEVTTDTGIEFQVVPRIDSVFEQDYFRNSGMMNYVLRKYKDY